MFELSRCWTLLHRSMSRRLGRWSDSYQKQEFHLRVRNFISNEDYAEMDKAPRQPFEPLPLGAYLSSTSWIADPRELMSTNVHQYIRSPY